MDRPHPLNMTEAAWPSFLVHSDVFDELECDELDALGRTAAIADGEEQAGIEGLGDPGALRDTTVAWIPRNPASEWAFERLDRLAATANQHWRLAIDGIAEDLQYTLYDSPGSHYTWHHDGLERGVEDRKVSLVVQLSDPEDYQGADLQFLEVATDYDPAEMAQYRSLVRARGTAISFCSFEYHRVTPLEAGVRRSLVAWVSGPPLR